MSKSNINLLLLNINNDLIETWLKWKYIALIPTNHQQWWNRNMPKIKIISAIINITNEISNSKIEFIPIHNTSVVSHVCFVLFIVCLYICVCECLLQNNNHKTKYKDTTTSGSAFEPGGSGLPYCCTTICVRSWCTWRASCVAKTKTKKNQEKSIGNPICGRRPEGGVPPPPGMDDWYAFLISQFFLRTS